MGGRRRFATAVGAWRARWALLALALAAPGAARAAVKTYDWTTGTGTFAGFASAWTSCVANTGITAQEVAPMSTTANTCATNATTTLAGPLNALLFVSKDAAYAVDTLVTGRGSGNQIVARSGSTTASALLRLHLGYAKGGAFTAFGYADVGPLTRSDKLYTPNLSAIQGVAPAGSVLAMRVELVQNTAGNTVTLYMGSASTAGESGVVVVNEQPLDVYDWQVGAGTFGGIASTWTTCAAQANVTATVVGLMSNTAGTACNQSLSTTKGGPFDLALFVSKDAAFTQDTVVYGQKLGNQFSLASAAPGGTVRFHLGYAKGGVFTSFGAVDAGPLTTSSVSYAPDFSAVTGVAPSGSVVAMKVELLDNVAGNAVTLYLDGAQSSGRLATQEAAVVGSSTRNFHWQTGTGTWAGVTSTWTTCGAKANQTDRVVAPMTAGTPTTCNQTITTTLSSPFEVALFVSKDGAYGADTVVMGQKTGNAFSFTSQRAISPASKVRVELGYVLAGIFNEFNHVDLGPVGTTATRFTPDMSGISGVAPAGSSLAMVVKLAQNSGGNTMTVTMDGTPSSGEFAVVESAPAGNSAGTMQVTNGTNPADAVVAPGSGAVWLDGFAVRTTDAAAPIHIVTVLFDEGTAAAVALLEVTSDDGSVVYGSVANPATDTIDVPLGTPIVASAAAPQPYRLRMTPKTQAVLDAMGANGQKAFVVRGRVYQVTSPLFETIDDYDGARVVVDNLPPPAPTGLAVVPQSGKATVRWTLPVSSELAEVLVLRSTTAAFADAPVDGVGFTATAATKIACTVAGTATTCDDLGLVNGTDYYYKAFTKDLRGNYSAATAVAGPFRPGATTTLAAGAAPAASAVVCPGGAATATGTFQLSSTPSADTVTGVTVTLPTGSASLVESVSVATSGGVVQGAPQATPVGDAWTVAGLGLAAPTSGTTAWQVLVKPRTHAALGGTGAAVALTAKVTAASHTLATPLAILDDADATLTVDDLAPAAPTGLTLASGVGQVTLSWSNPAAGTPPADFASYVVVLRSTQSAMPAPAEGTLSYAAGTDLSNGLRVACAGNLTSCVDSTVAAGTTYYYRVHARDACGNWSAGAATYGGSAVTLPDLALSAGAQPAPATLPAGGSAIVGRIRLTASAGAVVLDALRLVNAAGAPAAVAGADVAKLVLADDVTGDTLAASTWDGTAWVFDALGLNVAQGTTTTLRVGVILGSGATTGRRLALQVSPSGVRTRAPAVASGVAVTGPEFTVAATTLSDGTAARYLLVPQVAIVNPTGGAVVSGDFRLQVQIYDPDDALAAQPLSYAFSTNGTAPDCSGTAKTLTPSTRYFSSPRLKTYERTISLAADLGNQQGTYTIVACARNSKGTSLSRAVTVAVVAKGKGDGALLVRDNSSQLCTDCHALRTHSSQNTSRRYGTWSLNCRDCHEPHGTPNVSLMNREITPPRSQTPRPVKFSKTTGHSAVAGASDPANASYVNEDGTGPCQVCHTRTSNFWNSEVPRWRNDSSTQQGGPGNKDSHYTQTAGTRRCTDCHKHTQGFSPESRGGTNCNECHQKIWERMSGAVAVTSAHRLGNVPSVNSSATDTNTTWGAPLSGIAAAQRSCMNMCHPDKRHNEPGGWTHSFGVYSDATSQASRSLLRGPDGEVTGPGPTSPFATGGAFQGQRPVSDTDFDSTQANGGMCMSCHRNAIDSNPDRRAFGISDFTQSAHNYAQDPVWGAWNYTLRDGSRFLRNCTKCHSDRSDNQPGDATYPFGAVHYSDYPKLLAGSLNPGTAGVGAYVCYNCHGNGVIGQNRSNDIATPASEDYSHPVNDDVNHRPGEAEYNTAAWGNHLGAGTDAAAKATRHANCLDCHDTHKARRGGHSYQIGKVTTVRSGTLTTSTATVTGYGTSWHRFYESDTASPPGSISRFRVSSWKSTIWCEVISVASKTQLTIGKCRDFDISPTPTLNQVAPPADVTGQTAYRMEVVTNQIPPSVVGSWGVKYDWSTLAAGAKPGAANFTKKKLEWEISDPARRDLEPWLCFKCHSTYEWGNETPPPARSGFEYYVGQARFTANGTAVTGSNGTTPAGVTATDWLPTGFTDFYKNALIRDNAEPNKWYPISAITTDQAITLGASYTGPNGGVWTTYTIKMTHTDQAQEFNPKNRSFHPVLARCSSNPANGNQPNIGLTRNILPPFTTDSLMTCTDCHESDGANDPNGPHGSSYKFMLKGPNRRWDENLANSSSGMPAGTFCANCHDASFNNADYPTRFSKHREGDHAGGVKCFDCHVAIPHGASSPGLLIDTGGGGFSDVAPYNQARGSRRLFLNSWPANSTTSWQKSNCGCGGTSH